MLIQLKKVELESEHPGMSFPRTRYWVLMLFDIHRHHLASSGNFIGRGHWWLEYVQYK
jgi:hypothetical protein